MKITLGAGALAGTPISVSDYAKMAEEFLKERKTTLALIWIDCLKILHPFMPFVTEEIWSMMPARSSGGFLKNKNLLMVEKWPFDPAQDL